jgi:hypothetical protein
MNLKRTVRTKISETCMGASMTLEPRTYAVTDDKGDPLADSHNILARWRNYFFQLLNVHGVKDIRQIELHTAEPLVPRPSASEVESVSK